MRFDSYVSEPMDRKVLPQIHRMQPPDWKNSVAPLFETHWGQAYFVPLQIVNKDHLLAIGELILLGDSAWLGNIVVDPEYQRRGIGKRITLALMDAAKQRNIDHQFLLATNEGAPLYQQLGFTLDSYYLFYQNNLPVPQIRPEAPILPLATSHLEAILELDLMATGEDRSEVLKNFLGNGSVYLEGNDILGFYLPLMGDGLVVAQTEEAGIALLQKRAADGRTFVALPEGNILANQYLESCGYTVFRRAALMHLGPMKRWQPEMIYGRIGGYLG